ncbi:hypothetical protein SPYCW_2169 [Sphingopyxis sp. EG6]|nr:hypothetical protein SPYCW_2169 [Sphingopyxis sp. EG6]
MVSADCAKAGVAAVSANKETVANFNMGSPRTPATKAEPAETQKRSTDVGVASGVKACNPGTEAAPAAWSSLDGGVRAAAIPWALAVSDPRRQVSWLAGQGLMHAFPGCPSG